MNSDPLLVRAHKLFSDGELNAAEKLAQQVLGRDRRNVPALHLLGKICGQAARYDDALRYLSDASLLADSSHDIWRDLGLVHLRLARLDQAMVCLSKAISLRPDSADAASLLGDTLASLGRFPEALKYYDHALLGLAGSARIWANRGVALQKLGCDAEALTSYGKALELDPGQTQAANNKATILRSRGLLSEALAALDGALQLNPKYLDAQHNRGLVLLDLGRLHDALGQFDDVLKQAPDHVDVLVDRAVALYRLNQIDEAIQALERARKVRPDAPSLLNNLAATLLEINKPAQALAHVDHALAIEGDFARALNTRGLALHALGDFSEALASFQKAQVLAPDYAEAHVNESFTLLLTGDFANGWDKYEWRRKLPALAQREPGDVANWSGIEPLRGKSILLYADQGLGDTIQFVRFAPLVKKMGCKVVLQVQPALVELLSTTYGTSQIIPTGTAHGSCDFASPLASLPKVFDGQLPPLASRRWYLRADQHRIQAWKKKLNKRDTARIGFAWSANVASRTSFARSIPLPNLAPILSTAHQFIPLKIDLSPDEREFLRGFSNVQIHSLDPANMADAAALIACLDVVISIDTSIAHLAGALGKDVWILLPFPPDWRWGLTGQTTDWYPTARLFRASSQCGWNQIIADVRMALEGR